MGRFDSLQSTWRETALLEIIDEIRRLFCCCFETPVVSVIVNIMPGTYKSVREIRNMISLLHIDSGTVAIIRTGAAELEEFIKILSAYFLPHAKELLQVSPLKPEGRPMDSETFMLRRFLLCALPENIDRLERLTRELNEVLEIAY